MYIYIYYVLFVFTVFLFTFEDVVKNKVTRSLAEPHCSVWSLGVWELVDSSSYDYNILAMENHHFL